MKIRILGSGTSTGIPEVGCTCPVCTSDDWHDRRLRASSMIYTDDAVILIDCGPDFREQMLRMPIFEKIDAVLITHEHYDHVGGLDDLRPFCRFGEIPIYANAFTSANLRSKMPYCFGDRKYPGVPLFSQVEIEANTPFSINQTEILPFCVMHGHLPILGYRIGKRMAYITDMLTMPEESYECLDGLDLLIINALRFTPHLSHQTITEAIAAAQRINARETYFIHMNHHAGLHRELEQQLPHNIHLAYDGMTLDF